MWESGEPGQMKWAKTKELPKSQALLTFLILIAGDLRGPYLGAQRHSCHKEKWEEEQCAQWKLVDTEAPGKAVSQGGGRLSGTLPFPATESEEGTHACISPAGSTSY